jgi:hypothetical protein
MAKRIFTTRGLTFNAVADGILTGVNWMALKAAANQLVDVQEVMISGMQTTSNLGGFNLKRASTNETTPTTLAAPNTDGLALPTGTALSSTVTAFIAAATAPTASTTTTDATLNFGLNTFGGIIRWNAAPTQEWKIQGSAAPGIESVLYNSSTALGVNAAANIHIIYEPY